MPAGTRRSTFSRDSAHRIGDAVEQPGRRVFLASGAAMAGRAQPSDAPHTFSPNDVGALNACVLRPNDMMDYNFVADRHRMPKVAPREARQLRLARPAIRYACSGMHGRWRGSDADRDQVESERSRTRRGGPRIRATTCEPRDVRRTMAPDGAAEKRRSKSTGLGRRADGIATVLQDGGNGGRRNARRAGAGRERCVGVVGGGRSEARLQPQQGQLHHLPRDQGRQQHGQRRARAQRHEEALLAQGSVPNHLRRDQAQPAHGHAAVRAQPHPHPFGDRVRSSISSTRADLRISDKPKTKKKNGKARA